MEPRIQNIMCTVNLGCRLDLSYIARHGYNLEYNPKIFNPIVMKLKKPKSTALVFASGKIVCTGTKDEENSKIAARRFARIIQKLGFPVRFLNFKITNIVASTELNFRPNFKDFEESENDVYQNGRFVRKKFIVDYNQELFPGLIYRKGVTVLLFRSGKVILTNAKTRVQIYDAYTKFEKSVRDISIKK